MFWNTIENLFSLDVLTDPAEFGRQVLQFIMLHIPIISATGITAIILTAMNAGVKATTITVGILLGIISYGYGIFLSFPEAAEFHGFNFNNPEESVDISDPEIRDKVFFTSMKYAIFPALVLYLFSGATLIWIRSIYRKVMTET